MGSARRAGEGATPAGAYKRCRPFGGRSPQELSEQSEVDTDHPQMRTLHLARARCGSFKKSAEQYWDCPYLRCIGSAKLEERIRTMGDDRRYMRKGFSVIHQRRIGGGGIAEQTQLVGWVVGFAGQRFRALKVPGSPSATLQTMVHFLHGRVSCRFVLE